MTGPAPLAPPPASSANEPGAYAGSFEHLERGGRSRSPLARLRRKRWVYAVAASEHVLAAGAVVDGGWFAGAFAWAVDRRTGAVVLEASGAGFPGIHARVSDHGRPGAFARFVGRRLAVRIDRDARGWLLDVECERGAIDAALEVPSRTTPFTFVAAIPGGGLRATEKSGGFAAMGEVRLRDRSLPLGGGFGGVDVTAGVLARETAWRWAFATGAVAGEPFALNLCEGFGVPPREPGENVAFRSGAPYRLPPVAFRRSSAEWRIESADGAVDLAFTPLAAHRERRNVGVLRTRFAQVAGAFDGTLPGPDGAPFVLAGLPGVVEDHWAVW